MTPTTYRGWSIHYDPTPLPIRAFDYTAIHPDYDASYDDGEWSGNGLAVHAATLTDLRREIDDAEADLAEQEEAERAAAAAHLSTLPPAYRSALSGEWSC